MKLTIASILPIPLVIILVIKVAQGGTLSSAACNKIPAPGKCKAAFAGMFWNSTAKECQGIWGGCEEDEPNFFWELEDCLASCGP